MPLFSSERRTVPRFSVDYRVIYDYLPFDAPATRMLDVSVKGAAVEAPDAFPVGAITFFRFAPTDNSVVMCRAQVIYVQPLDRTKYRVGVLFRRLDMDGAQVLRRILEQRAQSV